MPEPSSYESMGEFRDQGREEPLGYEYFDPIEELDKLKVRLRDMPVEEREACRAEEFDILRIKIAEQRLAIAKISAQIENVYHNRPEEGHGFQVESERSEFPATREDLVTIVKDNAEEAKISPHQFAIFERKIDRVIEADGQMDTVYKEYTEVFGERESCRQLANHFFHFLPSKEVFIDRGPASMIFVIDMSDWPGLLQARAKKYGTSVNPRVAGFVAPDFHDEGQIYSVGARINYGAVWESMTHPLSTSYEIHEKRHGLDFSLNPVAVSVPEITKKIGAILAKDSSSESIRSCLDSIESLAQERIMQLVKTEILAYLEQAEFLFANLSQAKAVILGIIRSGLLLFPDESATKKHGRIIDLGLAGKGRSAERNQEMLLYWNGMMQDTSDNRMSYNYKRSIAEVVSNKVIEVVGEDYPEPIEEWVNDWADRVYNKILPNISVCIDAAIDINQDSGLNNQETVWLLQNEPIKHWPALSHRIKVLRE